MGKYKVLEEVTIDGVGVGAGNEVELTEEQAAALEGKVERVDGEAAPAAPAESAPEAAPETPEAAPESAPESAPEAAPEASPEADQG